MPDDAHDLELSVLHNTINLSTHMSREICEASLKPLILQHPLDGSILATGGQLGLEDDAKRPIANNLALSVCELSSLSGQAVLNLFANDFCRINVSKSFRLKEFQGISPPILRLEKAAGRFCDISRSKTTMLSRVRRARDEENSKESSRGPREVRVGQLRAGLSDEQ